MKNIIEKVIYFLLVLTWMIVIFKFSNEPAEVSGNTSLNVTRVIVELVENKETPEEQRIEKINQLDPIIRKIAHFALFAIGGFIIMLFINTYDTKQNKKIIISVIIGIIYACTDEIHQIFIPGRSGQITDVIIDSFGIIVGTYISLLIINVLNKIIKKR